MKSLNPHVRAERDQFNIETFEQIILEKRRLFQ